MSEKFGVDSKTRFLVLYFDAHMGIHEIAKIIHRPMQTIRDWETRAKKGEDVRFDKQRSGRPKSVTEETETKIIQMIKENPEGTSAKKLAARFGISVATISRLLAKKGYKYMGIDKSIIYSEEERVNRLDFCRKMLAEEGKLIYQTFYSDEMGIELNNAHKTRVWQIPSEKLKKKNVAENIKLGCWGAISAEGATSLEIYRKGMNGNLFRQVIEQHKVEMESIFPGEFYLVQDNHPTHRMNEEWIVSDQNLRLIKLPKRSPDLNIIENLWAALKERVASDSPTDEKELRASLLSNWEVLTRSDRLKPFFETLHIRYLDCVAKKGHKLPG